MSLFKSDYIIEADKSVDDTKALFEMYFQDMSKKGYSMNTVILNPDYGRKKFTGTIDADGVYNARLIVSHETDDFYRSAPLNKIEFSGDTLKTKVRVSVSTTKNSIVTIAFLIAALVILCFALASLSYIGIFIPAIIIALVLAIAAMIPIFISKHRINAAKDELIYIFKYSDKFNK